MTAATRLALVAIARPTFDVPLAQEMHGRARRALEDQGYALLGPDQLIMNGDEVTSALQTLQGADYDLLVLLQATFADSSMAQQIARASSAPVLLWALPEERSGGRLRLNSFCGINLAGHGLRRAGLRYETLYGLPEDERTLAQIQTLAQAARAVRQLRQTRIGRVGNPPDGFETCIANVAGLKETFGAELVHVDLQSVFAAARQADAARVEAQMERVGGILGNLGEVDAQQTRGTLSTYVTLHDLAAEEKLDGLAVRCWPEFFTDLGCAACGAMSLLSHEQTPCSCEADVNGTLTQVLLQSISGAPAFGTDLVSFDSDDDTAILWHCGLAPLEMCDPDYAPRAALHSNRRMPLLFEFPLKPGRVTLARLSEASGEFRLVIGAGEMLQAPPAFSGTSGTLRFDSGAEAAMQTILSEGLEHHVSLTYGDHVEALLAFARMLNLPVLRL